MAIASNEVTMSKLIQQVVPSSDVPSSDAHPLDKDITVPMLTAFMCMAYSPETHQYLVRQEITDAIMTAPSKQDEASSDFCR